MSSRDRTILAILVLVVAAVGGWFVLVQPERHKTSQLGAQITTARQNLTVAEQRVQTGLAAEAEYDTYAKQLRSLDAAVPADSQIPSLINELQSASTKSHTGFEAVTLSGTTAAPAVPAPAAAPATTTTTTTSAPASTSTSFPSQSFTLGFDGTYFSVADLLGTLASYVQADNKKFRASGRLLTISTVSFAAGKNGGFPNVTANVTVSDYDIPPLGSSSSSATSATS